jgi:predicted nuclease of predicted toxin-antitoxin system
VAEGQLSVRFLVDTQLPKALAVWLGERGHTAEHVLDVGLGQAKDTPVWRYAELNRAVIVTKDEDFAEWVRRGRPGPAVVWLRIGNSSKRALLAWIEPLLPAVIRHLEQGNRLVEVR